MNKHPGTLDFSVRSAYEPGRECPAVAFWISEREPSENRWRITVEARIGKGGARVLGVVRTTAGTISAPDAFGHNYSQRPGARCVFTACCPGAVGWAALIEKVYRVDGDGATFDWSSCPEAIGLPGVVPLFGYLEHPRYTYQSAAIAGGAAGSWNVRENERVTSISVWQVGDGAWFRVVDPVEGNLMVIMPPPDGSTTMRPDGTLWGPCVVEIDFTGNAAGKGGFLIEGLR